MSFSLAFLYELSDEVEPSSVKTKPIPGRSHFVGLALLVEINSNLIQKRSERLRIDQISLCNKVATAAASASLGTPGGNLTVCGHGSFPVVPNNVVAEAKLFHSVPPLI